MNASTAKLIKRLFINKSTGDVTDKEGYRKYKRQYTSLRHEEKTKLKVEIRKALK